MTSPKAASTAVLPESREDTLHGAHQSSCLLDTDVVLLQQVQTQAGTRLGAQMDSPAR